MGMGGKKSTPKPDPAPQIVVSPGSGSGMTDGQTTAASVQRTETATPQASLLTQNDEDENLKKGIY